MPIERPSDSLYALILGKNILENDSGRPIDGTAKTCEHFQQSTCSCRCNYLAILETKIFHVVVFRDSG